MKFTFTTESEYKYWETVVKKETRKLFDELTGMEPSKRRDEIMANYKAGQELYTNLIGEHMSFIKAQEANDNKKFIKKAINIIGMPFGSEK